MLTRWLKAMLPYTTVMTFRNRIFDVSQTFPAPSIFNQNGERMSVFYLQDEICRNQPYGFVAGRFPSRILWDRYNKTLETQFYTHDEILRLSPFIPKKRFAYYIESEALIPGSYALLQKDKGRASEFSAVFSTSDAHLETLPNAMFCPAGGVWYGQGKIGGGSMRPDGWQYKTKNVSIVSSAKKQCPLHLRRIELANMCSRNHLADTYGTFDGGNGILIGQSLEDYRFSIVVENHISNYYFTEKLLNCFAAMTIPIYIGARKTGQFFNEDGIVRLDERMDDAQMERIILSCKEDLYKERINAVIYNYWRVQEFLVIEDWLYKNHGDLFV